MHLHGQKEHWSDHPLVRGIAWVLLAVAVWAGVELGLMAWAGGVWDCGIRCSHPKPRFVSILVCGFGWFFLRHGARYGRRQWVGFAGKLALGAISTVFAFFVAEIGLRVYLQRMQSVQSIDNLGKIDVYKRRIASESPLAEIVMRSEDRKLIYELIPNVNMDFGHHRVITNSRGMRDRSEFTPEKPANTVRIVGIGDSGMFGWGVEQDECYLAVLESNLNQRADGTVYEVLNMGVPGYNSELEEEDFEYKGLAFKPDIVIVGWCDNDFGLPYFVPQEGQWTRKDISFLYYLLFKRKEFADIALTKLSDTREFDEKRIPEHFMKGLNVSGVQAAFGRLKELGEQKGFHVLVFGPMQTEAMKVCQTLDIPYFNTWEKIPEGTFPEEYSVHFMHPHTGGHRLLAERLEKDLRDRGWLNPKL